jgi:enoyl-CoA hydratase/carnithine racemase
MSVTTDKPVGATGFETLTARQEGGVVFAEIAAPPMNLLGPELVRDLVALIGHAEADDATQVLVFSSADPDYFILAERYGWINRALPAGELGDFVRALVHRIAGFPAGGRVAVKDRVNAIGLGPAEDFRRDSNLFGEGMSHSEVQGRIRAAFTRGFQTRDGEMDLGRVMGELV